MTKTERTDPHCPSKFDPANYAYKGIITIGPWGAKIDQNINKFDIRAALASNGWTGGNFAKKGTCDHCGARFGYGSVFTYAETGELITVGWQCAGERFSCLTKADMDQKKARKAAKLARGVHKFIDAQPDAEDIWVALDADHHIITDIREKSFRRGRISRKQCDFVLSLAKQVTDNPPAEVKAGLRTIKAEVVSIKETYSDKYAKWIQRITVVTSKNERLNGLVPKFLGKVAKGDKIVFRAEIVQSNNDKCFGFFNKAGKPESNDNHLPPKAADMEKAKALVGAPCPF